MNNIGDIKNKISDWRLGPNYLENLTDFHLVFRTPGLAYLTPEIQNAQKSGVEISSQTKLFFDLCPCPIIGVTGTKGKGTTATLIYEILKNNIASGYPTRFGHPIHPSLELRSGHRHSLGDIPSAHNKVYLAGNIGNAPIEFIDKLTQDDIVVLELSSFQLQDLEKSPHIAVVLNISSDHLDVHKDNEEYIEAKTNIVKHQRKYDFACINADYLTSFEFGSQTKAQVYWFSQKSVDRGVWVKNKKEVLWEEDAQQELIINTSDIFLRGEHNLENVAAAALAVKLAGVSLETIRETIKKFHGLEHRLEFIVEHKGVKFYNDSFSTNPDTAIAAIRSFTEPIILIAGGSEKNADYFELGEVIARSNIKTLLTIGQTGKHIKDAVLANGAKIKIIDSCKNLDEVLNEIKQEMNPGDVVLMSPASASFDWFLNYKDRGKQFKNAILRKFTS